MSKRKGIRGQHSEALTGTPLGRVLENGGSHKKRRTITYSAVFPFDPIDDETDDSVSDGSIVEDDQPSNRHKLQTHSVGIDGVDAAFEDWLCQADHIVVNNITPVYGALSASPGEKSKDDKNELCHRCKKFNDHMFILLRNTGPASTVDAGIPHGTYKHSSRYEMLQTSARTCGLCSLIYRTLVKNNDFKQFNDMIQNYNNPGFNNNKPYHSDGVSDLDYQHMKPVQFSLLITPRRGVRSGYVFVGLRLRFSALVKTRLEETRVDIDESLLLYTSSAFAQSLGSTTRVPLDICLGAAEKVRLLQTWLSQAPKPETATQLTDTETPTRLLEIDQGCIRLVEVADVLTSSRLHSILDIPYAAISYRWGKSQECTTRSGTKERYYCGIQLSELPKTFQDAVFVTKLLGIAYLWIDALCIIQDSPEDWKSESLKMGDIYRGAQVVLAIHCAADTAQGFLDQSLSKRKAVQLAAPQDGARVSIGMRANFDADVTRSQLSKRGWVVQERFLASRTIHFTDGQIYWETPSGACSEYGVIPVATSAFTDAHRRQSTSFGLLSVPELSALLHGTVKPVMKRVSTTAESSTAESSTSEPSAIPYLIVKWNSTTIQWLDFVEMYSGCDLTQEQDKLVAISGVAKVIQRACGISYYAGIWADFLCQGLMWLRRTEPLKRLAKERAPSWSWAALDGSVQFPNNVRQGGANFCPMARLVSIGGIPSNNSAEEAGLAWLNGPGTLTLDVEVRRLPYNKDRPSWYAPVLDRRTTTIGPGPRRPRTIEVPPSYWGDRLFAETMSLHDYVPIRTLREETLQNSWVAFDTEDTSRWIDQGEVMYCAKIATAKARMSSTFDFVLFLEPVPSKCGKIFRRIGAGQVALEGAHGVTMQEAIIGWKRMTISIV